MQSWNTLIYSIKYEINREGQIRNKETNRIISTRPDKDGYFRIVLWIDSKRKNFLVHRLIAEHFIPNSENKPQINHIDGNKQNNSISNLEWVTLSENRRHAFETGLQIGRPGVKHHNCKLTEKDVQEIKNLVQLKTPRKEISKKYGIHKNHIYRITKGTRWKHLT